MNDQEKEIIRMFEAKLKEKYVTDTREEIISFLDKFIVNMVLIGYSDELLRCLFDVRQAVVLGKEIQKEMEETDNE